MVAMRGDIWLSPRRSIRSIYRSFAVGRSYSGDRYDDEDIFDEEEFDEEQSPSGTAMTAMTVMPPPPYHHGQRQQQQQQPQQQLNGNHRKDRIENGEIIRESEFGEAHGSGRFPGNAVPLPLNSGPLIEKDEFNKIIPESKKAPQVGPDSFFRCRN